MSPANAHVRCRSSLCLAQSRQDVPKWGLEAIDRLQLCHSAAETTCVKWLYQGRSETRSLREWVRGQPVTYTTKVFVRSRRSKNTWVSWNHFYGGGPRLVVRTRGIEVSAPHGMMLERRSFLFSAETATMWRDRVGWAGTRLGRKDCIRLQFGDAVELALTPDSGVEEAWEALIQAGVRPEDRPR